MSIWHLIILLVVVVVIFGTGKLRNIGSDLGSAMRDFKKGLNGDEDEARRKEEAERLRADPPASPADKATQSQRDSSDSK
ncbi:twin-arginine translocase TatA/TatE family subunit [Rhodanobacter sp. B2A1Ga4]|uniref:twin-arginine translocase TatA/TatE family subunit n=1 Tax=Rhodanobacter sp. B2A1Ga4 TaxID=2778647 RepID=UPI001B380992|nr:twin-arginine translocase TatA/TatE family subunit [Rhodanobacter sp. B2A1Ga4]MBQ4855523.1 twin-arginine translocase TatA/TatE family subunit [Rhodanobacter sp. B2A1Ga4]